MELFDIFFKLENMVDWLEPKRIITVLFIVIFAVIIIIYKKKIR